MPALKRIFSQPVIARELFRPEKGGIDRSPVNALSTTGTVNIDCSLGNYFTCALTGNVTLTISNPPPTGVGQTILVDFVQDSTARTLTVPGSFYWLTASVLKTTSGSHNLLAITTMNNGTTWLASLGIAP